MTYGGRLNGGDIFNFGLTALSRREDGERGAIPFQPREIPRAGRGDTGQIHVVGQIGALHRPPDRVVAGAADKILVGFAIAFRHRVQRRQDGGREPFRSQPRERPSWAVLADIVQDGGDALARVETVSMTRNGCRM